MRRCFSFVAAIALLLAASPAWAHFVWLSIEKDTTGQPAAHVWFSELAEPDSADLLDKLGAIKVWSRTADGKTANVSVVKKTSGTGGALVGSLPPGVAALSSHINYGVLTRREQTFQLQ